MHCSNERSAIKNVDSSEKYQPSRGLQQVPRPGSDRVLASGLGILGVLGLAVVFWFPPIEHPFYPGCSFFDATGLHCPGCGGFRAWHDLLHGRVLSAFRKNAMAVTLLPGLVIYWYVRRFMVRGERIPNLFQSPRWLAFLAMVVLAFGFLRNLPWGPFRWFAP